MITISRMNKLKEAKAVKALVDIIVDGKIVIKGLRVVENKGEIFVRLPDKKVTDGSWVSIIEIIDVDLYREVAEKVLAEYNKS